MFDIGWSEMMVIGALALIVIGPKDLPKALKTVGKWVRRAKDLAREFQSGVDDMVRESELQEAREALKNTGSINRKIEETVDPSGDMAKAMREHGESIQKELESEDKPAAAPEKPAEVETKPEEAAKPAASAEVDDSSKKTGTPS